jgi:hypothetical protein
VFRDIAAFEGLLQAMLFFDEVWCVDDFDDKIKRKYVVDLKYITFLARDDFPYDSMWTEAHNLAHSTAIRVVNGEIDASAFQRILGQIRAHLNFDFVVRTSTVDLIARLFTDDAELWKDAATLWELITQQMRGEPRSPNPRHASRFREEDEASLSASFWHDRRHLFIDKSMATIAASLHWLAMKTIFYVTVGESCDFDIILHPIRHAYLAHYVQTRYRSPVSTYDSVMAMLQKGIPGTVREIRQASDPFVGELKLPMWAAYLATKTENPSEFLTIRQHLRQERLFVEARRHLDELRGYSRPYDHGKYVREVNQLNQSLAGVAARMLTKYGVTTSQGIAVAPIMNIALRLLGQPSAAGITRVPVPRGLVGSTDNRGFRGIFRSKPRSFWHRKQFYSTQSETLCKRKVGQSGAKRTAVDCAIAVRLQSIVSIAGRSNITTALALLK